MLQHNFFGPALNKVPKELMTPSPKNGHNNRAANCLGQSQWTRLHESHLDVWSLPPLELLGESWGPLSECPLAWDPHFPPNITKKERRESSFTSWPCRVRMAMSCPSSDATNVDPAPVGACSANMPALRGHGVVISHAKIEFSL